MASGDEILWRGTSSEDRTVERRDRLLLACRDIVARDGSTALSVRAVCRAANIGPRYFYESFPDTGALLLAAYEGAVAELMQAISVAAERDSAAWQDTSFEARLHRVFGAAADHLTGHPDSGKLIFREALASDLLRTHAAVTLPLFVVAVKAVVFGAEDRPAASRAHLEATVLSGGLAAAFAEWLSGSSAYDRAALVDYCTRATLALLTLPDSESES